MTTILFPTLGSAGDILPLIPLARCMMRRGYNCIIIASPRFEDVTGKFGVSFLPLGTDQQYRELTEDERLWHASQAFQVVVQRGILPFLQPLMDIYETFAPEQTVIVSPLLLFASHIAHQKYGFRFASLQLQPALLRSVHAPPVLGSLALPDWLPPRLVELYYRILDRTIIDPLLAPSLNSFRQKYGLPPSRRIFHNDLFSEQLNLCLFPQWYAAPQVDWPAHTFCTGFIAPPEMPVQHQDILQTFLASGDAPVVVTPGSALPNARHFFEVAVAATLRSGRRAILLTHDSSQIPNPLPEGCLYLPFYPLGPLLPQAAAIVHAGGTGTLAQAVAAGIPQLIIPLTNDQPDNAARIRRLGLGEVLQSRQLTPRSLANMITKILENKNMLQTCKQYSRRVDFDRTLELTADHLEDLAR